MRRFDIGKSPSETTHGGPGSIQNKNVFQCNSPKKWPAGYRGPIPCRCLVLLQNQGKNDESYGGGDEPDEPDEGHETPNLLKLNIYESKGWDDVKRLNEVGGLISQHEGCNDGGHVCIEGLSRFHQDRPLNDPLTALGRNEQVYN